MFINNYKLNLLNVKDENIHIITEWKEKIIKNQKYKIIKSILIYNKRVIFHHHIINHLSILLSINTI